MIDLEPLHVLEAQVEAGEETAIKARWEFGRNLLPYRVGKKLPKGELARVVDEFDLHVREIDRRMQFAERCPDEESFGPVRTKYRTWDAIKNDFLPESREHTTEKPPPPEGMFSTVVIDPPWPMEKIPREVRPNQPKALDYPTMDEYELRDFTVPAADDAHLYLWTTHKHLPLALELVEAWGFGYQCLLTWRKNVGITPFSWMYSTEHVVFARRGSLDLLAMGRRLDFEAKVREHSRKPAVFYELVRDVSPGPRIDMFAREAHEGFKPWGNEPERFADAA